MSYKFAVLDPRSIPAATEANERVFAAGPVYGIEVTVPALAARCASNLDPQHTDGNVNQAAIEVAVAFVTEYNKGRPCCGGGWDSYYCPKCDGADCPPAVPSRSATLGTVRADLDSVGGMAIFSLWAKGSFPKMIPDTMPAGALLSPCSECAGDGLRVHEPSCSVDAEASAFELSERIRKVADADKFSRGPYPGPRPLPTNDNPWPEGGSAESSRPLAAIAAAVADFKVPIEQRVATMERWLLTGEEPQQYRDQVEKERLGLITALENGQIKAEVENGVAVVVSTHRAATLVGYCLAPVVIALNPSFRLAGGDPHTKFTVCQYKIGHCDLKTALAELQQLETGWGGSPTIIGSPQGVASQLAIEQVVEVVVRRKQS